MIRRLIRWTILGAITEAAAPVIKNTPIQSIQVGAPSFGKSASAPPCDRCKRVSTRAIVWGVFPSKIDSATQVATLDLDAPIAVYTVERLAYRHVTLSGDKNSEVYDTRNLYVAPVEVMSLGGIGPGRKVPPS